MCARTDCARYMGQWVRFQTPWGMHRGVISAMNNRAVLIRVPRSYAPIQLAASTKVLDVDDEKRLDLALAWGRYGGYGGGYGYGARRGWGAPGYGGWYGGWWWWWLAFAWIFALAFLW